MRDKIIASILMLLLVFSLEYQNGILIECMELGGKYIDDKCYKGDFVEVEL